MDTEQTKIKKLNHMKDTVEDVLLNQTIDRNFIIGVACVFTQVSESAFVAKLLRHKKLVKCDTGDYIAYFVNLIDKNSPIFINIKLEASKYNNKPEEEGEQDEQDSYDQQTVGYQTGIDILHAIIQDIANYMDKQTKNNDLPESEWLKMYNVKTKEAFKLLKEQLK